jgi:hypothetical protein
MAGEEYQHRVGPGNWPRPEVCLVLQKRPTLITRGVQVGYHYSANCVQACALSPQLQVPATSLAPPQITFVR